MNQQYLTFTVDKQSYGIQISSIREINRISEITKIPDAPTHVAGVMNLRGKVVPVVSLRRRMQLEEVDATKMTCTIVVETSSGQVGVVVDSVSSVLSLEAEAIDPTPISQVQQSYIVGIGKLESSLVMLIDIEKCLADHHQQFIAPDSEELKSAS